MEQAEAAKACQALGGMCISVGFDQLAFLTSGKAMNGAMKHRGVNLARPWTKLMPTGCIASSSRSAHGAW